MPKVTMHQIASETGLSATWYRDTRTVEVASAIDDTVIAEIADVDTPHQVRHALRTVMAKLATDLAEEVEEVDGDAAPTRGSV